MYHIHSLLYVLNIKIQVCLFYFFSLLIMAVNTYIVEQVFGYFGLVMWSFQLVPQGKHDHLIVMATSWWSGYTDPNQSINPIDVRRLKACRHGQCWYGHFQVYFLEITTLAFRLLFHWLYNPSSFLFLHTSALDKNYTTGTIGMGGDQQLHLHSFVSLQVDLKLVSCLDTGYSECYTWCWICVSDWAS